MLYFLFLPRCLVGEIVREFLPTNEGRWLKSGGRQRKEKLISPEKIAFSKRFQFIFESTIVKLSCSAGWRS
jgi:hypothetical protein